jgi:hypothetical protein
MSTYLRALSPAKTEAGSEDSLFHLRLICLWGGGRKQSDLHSSVPAPLCVRQLLVHVFQCVNPVQVRAYIKKQPR